MTLIRVFSYSRCATCRKALAWLDSHNITYEVNDIVESPPTKGTLVKARDKLGDRKLLFNTSGVSYRALGAQVVKAMSEDEALDSLASDGKLIKRPFLITSEGEVLVGFKPDAWSDLLLK